jgi:hypothetical protein
MKNTMNDHSVEFILEVSSIFYGIFTDRIHAYEKVTGKTVTFTIIKCYDVCEIIMLKIFLVDIKYIVVRTEDDRYVSDASDLAFSYESKPTVIQGFSLENEVCVLKKIRNHALKFSAKLQNVQKV